LVLDHLTNVVRKLAPKSTDYISLTGKWSGTGQDLYAERKDEPLFRFDVTMEINTECIPIEASAILKFRRSPDRVDHLSLTGSFFNDEYIQMMYRSSDRKRRQFGVAILRVSPNGERITCHYAGFSPMRNMFVAGRIELGREE
jgi:hypothetical protein